MVIEIRACRALAADVVTAFEKVDRHLAKAGWLSVAVGFVVLSYYLVITGWTLSFVFFSLIGAGGRFKSFSAGYLPILVFFISALQTGLVGAPGVKEGIERLTRWLIPVSFIILIGLAIYTTTLTGFLLPAALLLRTDRRCYWRPSSFSASGCPGDDRYPHTPS